MQGAHVMFWKAPRTTARMGKAARGRPRATGEYCESSMGPTTWARCVQLPPRRKAAASTSIIAHG
eukprot:15472872-Alexandrium_andersonii.AAC.1